MAVYSTEENKKDECLLKTLNSLADTVDFKKHRLMLSVNGYTEETEAILWGFQDIISIIYRNEKNLGTAEAINRVWQNRKPGEHAIKMDDDVVIHSAGWIDLMEEAISREPKIGIVALKRKDLIQTTWHEDANYRSELIMLPHEPGQKWITIERTSDIMGTCTMFNSDLLDKIGYLKQPAIYGYDDTIASWRSHLSGFWNCFINHIEIDHIDNLAGPYQEWKHKHSGEHTTAMISEVHEYINKTKSLYYNPFEV